MIVVFPDHTHLLFLKDCKFLKHTDLRQKKLLSKSLLKGLSPILNNKKVQCTCDVQSKTYIDIPEKIFMFYSSTPPPNISDSHSYETYSY